MEEKKNPPSFFNSVRNGVITIGDVLRDGAVAVGDFVKENWKPITIGALTLVAGIVTVSLLSNNDDDPITDNNSDDDEGGSEMPEISQKAFDDIETFLGKGKAEEVAEQVRSGDMTPEAADNWGRQLWEQYERSRGRRDIEPEEWQDFEEGWRPEGW